MIAREGRVQAGFGRQVSRRGDRPDAGLFVIGNDRHCIAWLLLRCRRGLLDDLHLAVDAQNLRHLGFEFGIAAFQVIADLVRLHLLLVEYLSHRALHELGEAAVSFSRSVLTRMASQQSRRPQFVRIALQAFDLLELDGVDYRPLPLRQRKDRLARLLARVSVGIALNEHTDARGELVFRQACAMGLEGIVSTRLTAPTSRHAVTTFKPVLANQKPGYKPSWITR
jgi:hypothetical protein